jgi:hypothetical protein
MLCGFSFGFFFSSLLLSKVSLFSRFYVIDANFEANLFCFIFRVIFMILYDDDVEVLA